MVLIFGHPFASLTVTAVTARDYPVFWAIMAVLVATWLVSRRVLVKRPQQLPHVTLGLTAVYCVFLLISLQLRWEAWTGQRSWWSPSQALLSVVLSLLLPALFATLYLIKRNRLRK
jgi:hypothetical protein